MRPRSWLVLTCEPPPAMFGLTPWLVNVLTRVSGNGLPSARIPLRRVEAPLEWFEAATPQLLRPGIEYVALHEVNPAAGAPPKTPRPKLKDTVPYLPPIFQPNGQTL